MPRKICQRFHIDVTNQNVCNTMKQYCELNHFDISYVGTLEDDEITTMIIIFDNDCNAHNKPSILTRYLNGKKITYHFEKQNI